MLNDINSNLASSLLNSSVSSQSIANINNALKSKYGEKSDSTDLVDEGKISPEALKKYQAEQEIARYKKILNQMMGTEEEPSDKISALIQQVRSGNYEIDNKTLAASILADNDAENLLLQ